MLLMHEFLAEEANPQMRVQANADSEKREENNADTGIEASADISNKPAHIIANLTPAEVSRIIEMAWEDRTPFEAIEAQFGLNQDGVIKVMRANLKLGSFKLWRTRTHGQKTKHLKLRNPNIMRHKANHRVKQF